MTSGKRAVGPKAQGQRLRVVDQETARVVAICNGKGGIVGAGCLLTGKHVLTCRHVANRASSSGRASSRDGLRVKVMGLDGQPSVSAMLKKVEEGNTFAGDIALLELENDLNLSNGPAEFAAPLRHAGKTFSVLGFPNGNAQGRTASGILHASDTTGLVQMDAGSKLLVEGGFSGAPVWCRELNAFVGIVVAHSGIGIAWCIPSRRLCEFHNDMVVRFRIPVSDRPEIHDSYVDDPNLQLFGTMSNSGDRRLTARVWEAKDHYVVKARYECAKSGQRGRGRYVTFVTYPDFKHEDEDAYELFSPLVNGVAETEFWPGELFTMAAIGDAGDTALTLDLTKVKIES